MSNISPFDFISNMQSMTELLINKGHAYVASNNDVYFSVDSFPNYGSLSNRKVEDMQSMGEAIDGVTKKNVFDFALWKSSKSNEPFWNLPWGKSRPGWHLECSAMAHVHLGESIDIHGGGLDLKFPHHENEIAQSECAFNKKFRKESLKTNFKILSIIFSNCFQPSFPKGHFLSSLIREFEINSLSLVLIKPTCFSK